MRTTEVNKIVTVVLKKDDISYADEAYQWNYGQILRIQGGNLTKVVEVHFSLEETSGTSVTRIGTTVDGVTEVPIPDSHLENNNCSQDYTIYAYIYLEDGTAGRTEYEIAIPVKARTKPEVPGTPEEPELFRETVKAVNDAADRAETAEQNAKASATEAGKYAASASESAATAEKTKEDALKEVGEKKQEAIEAIQEQEETSVGKITTHADDEIQRIQNQTAGSKRELEQTITNAGVSKKELEYSIETAGTSKTALDKSTELAGTAKTELDTSTQKAGEAKTALDESARTASEMQETLSATVKQAGALDTSLGEKIETGTQLNEDITASGEKTVQDIQAAGSEQLGKMQTVAEEFTADREQITTNKEDIGSLKEEMSKNYLDDAKTKRSLDALWKLNQGISYQFETDIEKAYQKDIPSGAKLASVKKIGGRTIVWNQLVNLNEFENTTINGIVYTKNKDGSISAKGTTSGISHKNINYFKTIASHKYYVGSRGAVCGGWLAYGLYVPELSSYSMTGEKGTITTANMDADASLDFHVWDGVAVDITFYPQLVDLTKMFGAGNEPSTPEEFEAMFSEDYYPYNEGTLMSIPVNEVVEQGKNLLMLNSIIEGRYDVEIGERLISEPRADISVKDSCAVIKTKYEFNGLSLCTDILPTGNYIFSYETIGNEVRDTIYIINNSNIILQKIGNISGSAKKVYQIQIEDNNQKIAISMTSSSAGSTVRKQISVERGSVVTEYSPYHKNTYPIPQAILNLDGYGDGVSDDVYNYVDLENKEYHKRVGKYTIDGSENIVKEKSYWVMTVTDFEKPRPSTLNAICTNFKTSKSFFNKWGNMIFRTGSNGFVFTDSEFKFANANEVKDYFQQNNETIYYELDEEQVIDISDIIDNTFQEPIEVEAGGTLTFCNSNGDGYRLPVPNEEEYIVSLAEVGGGGASE